MSALAETAADELRPPLRVLRLGYLVPQRAFDGRVHSVFAQACNVTCSDLLLTLCTARGGDGPATLRLAAGGPRDLRDLFDVGEAFSADGSVARTAKAEIFLRQASVWRPAASRPWLGTEWIDTNLQSAARALAQRRRSQPNVIDREAAPLVAALAGACRRLDSGPAARQLARLVGWGEGLTPAGDDFIVGLLAGLDAVAAGDARRLQFRAALAAGLAGCLQRTTPIAAHYLKLAAGGHYGETLLALRDALLGEAHSEAVHAALQRALDVGATSGADTVSGLLAGLAAWLPAPALAQAA